MRIERDPDPKSFDWLTLYEAVGCSNHYVFLHEESCPRTYKFALSKKIEKRTASPRPVQWIVNILSG